MVRLSSWLFLLLLSTMIAGSAAELRAATIRGTVLDSLTREPIIGAKISIVGTKKSAITGFDGSYKMNDVFTGTYELRFAATGYETKTVSIVVTDSTNEIALNIELGTKILKGSEVIVTGQTENGSDISAQKNVQHSDVIMNAVSARTIEVSPDLSVADVSQRISAITMTRTMTGDAQYAIIRGMDERYNYTLVNGIKIPSPDNKERYIPLDIFPAELLDRVEVYKSLLPAMEGDAIGGAMNLVMKQAPDHLVVSVDAGSGYDGEFFDKKFTAFDFTSAEQSPRIANGPDYQATMENFPLSSWNYRSIQPGPDQYYDVTIGNRFFDDHRLGVIVSGSYQNTSRGASGTFFQTTVDQNDNSPSLSGVEDRVYSDQQIRSGAQASVDYALNEDNTFKLFATYASLGLQETRDLSDTDLLSGREGPGTGDIEYSRRSTVQTQDIGNITLSGANAIFGKDLAADWDLVYSKATMNQPDQATLALTTSVNLVNGAPGQQPTYLDVANDVADERIWESNSDQDKSAYLTLKSIENILGTATEFSYGGMYRLKTRVSNYDDYQLNPVPSPQLYNGNIFGNTFNVFNPLGTDDAPLDYNAHENIGAVFIQAKFQIGNIETVGGLRAENTDFGWSTAAPATITGKTGEIAYFDLLPSVSFKYSPIDNQNWRLSYFRSISRPGFYEVIPYTIQGEDYLEEGNPYLNRTQADNLDFRWEYFPGALDQLIAGVFYKSIYDPIEYTLVEEGSNEYLTPENLGTATNYGFELDATKYFSLFGIRANYTYTQSQITTDKTQDYRDASGNLTYRTAQQTRPLQGQAANIGNLSLLYRDFESGTDAQISLVYTGQNITSVSPYYDNDIWQNAYTKLDFSAEQQISGCLTIYMKVNNLLDAPFEESIHEPFTPTSTTEAAPLQTTGTDVLVRKETYERTYMLGIRYKL